MDREKVVSTFEKIISVCKEDGCDFVDLTFEDAEQILAMLKNQPQIVRCKDCKHWEQSNGHCPFNSIFTNAEWFCADGERRGDSG